jgi:hypothetical protein
MYYDERTADCGVNLYYMSLYFIYWKLKAIKYKLKYLLLEMIYSLQCNK